MHHQKVCPGGAVPPLAAWPVGRCTALPCARWVAAMRLPEADAARRATFVQSNRA